MGPSLLLWMGGPCVCLFAIMASKGIRDQGSGDLGARASGTEYLAAIPLVVFLLGWGALSFSVLRRRGSPRWKAVVGMILSLVWANSLWVFLVLFFVFIYFAQG